MELMEDGVFGGLEELFSGTEKEEFESFFISHKVGVETYFSSKTNPDNGVSADLLEQVSTDETGEEMVVDPLLDEDLDEVMESFRKRSQESQQISEEMIFQQDNVALTVAALMDLEQSLMVHGENPVVVLDDGEKGVHHHDNSPPGKRSAAEFDAEVLDPVPGGFMPSGDDASWRKPNAAVNHPRGGYFAGNNYLHHNYMKYFSWNGRNANGVSGPWSHLVTPGGVLLPSLSSSSPWSASRDGLRILLGGVVDIASFRLKYPHLFTNMKPYCPTAKSEPPPKRRRKVAEVKLPEGWEVVIRVRQNGKSKGQIDKYYINRTTNQRCRSLPELYRFLGLQPDGSEVLTS